MRNFVIIKKRNDIIQTKKYTQKITNHYFNISYEPSNSPRLLIVSTKKNCAHSVKRNLLKRRIKEIFFQYNKQYDFPYSLVVYNKYPAFLNSFTKVEEYLLQLLCSMVKKK